MHREAIFPLLPINKFFWETVLSRDLSYGSFLFFFFFLRVAFINYYQTADVRAKWNFLWTRMKRHVLWIFLHIILQIFRWINFSNYYNEFFFLFNLYIIRSNNAFESAFHKNWKYRYNCTLIDRRDKGMKNRITWQSSCQSTHRFAAIASFHGWKRLINPLDQIRASFNRKRASQIPGKGGKSSVKSETQSALPRKSSKVRLFYQASCIARRLKPGIGGIEIGGNRGAETF